MDTGLTILFRKNTLVTETATEEIDATGCYGFLSHRKILGTIQKLAQNRQEW